MKSAKIAALAIALIAAFLAGAWYNQRNAKDTPSAPDERKILHYSCPMHPQYTSDRIGDCPSCGMRLVPVYADDADGFDAAEHPSSDLPAGSLHVDLEKQQVIGVQVAPVERASGARNLRTVGRVAADETRIYIINATVDGWITSTRSSATGSYVKKDETLASFYSPEFLSAGQALLFALSSIDRVQPTGKENPAQKDQIAQFNINLQQYKDSLRNLGMGQLQIDEMIRTRKYMENVDITSPADGFIIARKVSNGLRFAKGDEMYRIADLSHVWILVDVFEQEEKYLRSGDRVRVTVPNQGTEVTARVTNVLPQFDPDSRTLKVRLEADNPGFRLRPDMFVDVTLPVTEPSAIVVPSEAVIDTGIKKRVFVDRGNGYFEPRDVETGWRFGGRVEILKGLMEGERIVVSGTFLVDSESRMKAAASGIYGESAKDPVCGMDVDVGKAEAAGRKFDYMGKTYYFCCDDCKMKFRANPAAYLKGKSGMTQSMAQSNPKISVARDPVCGMDVDPAEAKAAGAAT